MMQEAYMFEPLTWLEASVFFLALPLFKPGETAKWNALAIDRWQKYTETRHQLFSCTQSCAEPSNFATNSDFAQSTDFAFKGPSCARLDLMTKPAAPCMMPYFCECTVAC